LGAALKKKSNLAPHPPQTKTWKKRILTFSEQSKSLQANENRRRSEKCRKKLNLSSGPDRLNAKTGLSLMLSRAARWYFFQTKSDNVGLIHLSILGMDKTGVHISLSFRTFIATLVYFVAIWYILLYTSPFWLVIPRKIWQPCSSRNLEVKVHRNGTTF
jgi:hypothetical protein